MTKTKLYKITNTSLTYGLGCLLLFFLLRALDTRGIPVAFEELRIDLVSAFYFMLVMLMSIANWTVERVKWNSLIKSIHDLSKRELISSIALGLCANVLAPNRTGELAARLSHIPAHKRRSALYLNLFAASSQLLVTFLAGNIAMIFLLPRIQILNQFGNALSIVVILSAITLSLMVFFRSQLLKQLLLKKLRKSTAKVESVEINLARRMKVLGYSSLRYIIFILQFLLILLAIDAKIDLFDAALILSVAFMVNSFIPSNWLTELITKGSLIYFLAEFMHYEPSTIVTASIGLWFVNVLIPSTLSLYFLKDINWLRLIKS